MSENEGLRERENVIQCSGKGGEVKVLDECYPFAQRGEKKIEITPRGRRGFGGEEGTVVRRRF